MNEARTMTMTDGKGRAGARSGAGLSDNEILGIEIPTRVRPNGMQKGAAKAPEKGKEQGDPGSNTETQTQDAGDELEATLPVDDTAGEPTPEIEEVLRQHPEVAKAWEQERAYREIFPSVEAAKGAQEQLAEVQRLDGLFFANRPDTHAELAAAIYRMDPEAFRNLSRMMTNVLSNNGEGKPGGSAAAQKQEGEGAEDSGSRPSARQEGRKDNGAMELAAFYQEANSSAVQDLLQSIETQVDRLLPEGIAKGARQRVIGEIYREVDSSLQSNRALTQQVREAMRQGNFGPAHQRAVVTLIVNRARQTLPAAAKKVINEWTTGVLAANQAKRNRQQTAEKRVDVTGPGSTAGKTGKALTPSNIDYARVSDADILNM